MNQHRTDQRYPSDSQIHSNPIGRKWIAHKQSTIKARCDMGLQTCVYMYVLSCSRKYVRQSVQNSMRWHRQRTCFMRSGDLWFVNNLRHRKSLKVYCRIWHNQLLKYKLWKVTTCINAWDPTHHEYSMTISRNAVWICWGVWVQVALSLPLD